MEGSTWYVDVFLRGFFILTREFSAIQLLRTSFLLTLKLFVLMIMYSCYSTGFLHSVRL